MHIKESQLAQERFARERGWQKFPASLVFAHLVEEMGEIGRHILFEEGYKVAGLGHEAPKELSREFAQAFSLFLQICSHFEVNLEDAVLKEAELMEKRFSRKEWRRYMASYGRPRSTHRRVKTEK